MAEQYHVILLPLNYSGTHLQWFQIWQGRPCKLRSIAHSYLPCWSYLWASHLKYLPYRFQHHVVRNFAPQPLLLPNWTIDEGYLRILFSWKKKKKKKYLINMLPHLWWWKTIYSLVSTIFSHLSFWRAISLTQMRIYKRNLRWKVVQEVVLKLGNEEILRTQLRKSMWRLKKDIKL